MESLCVYMFCDLEVREGREGIECISYAFSSNEHGARNAFIREDFR